MRQKIRSTFLIFALLLIATQFFAQIVTDFRRTDVVYLKNGSVFRGQIESYEITGNLKLRIDKNQVVTFESKTIKKIVQEATEAEKQAPPTPVKAPKEYNFRERGIYIGSHLGYIGGNDIFGNYTEGLNAHLFGGYQFNRLVGVGLGVGVDFYNVGVGTVIPVYGTVRGYLRKTNVSPYYQFAAGYGFPITNEDSAFTTNQGGLYAAPELGIRIGASAETNMTIGLGLQWQKAEYRQDFGDGIGNNTDPYTFRRFNLKIGVLF